ncbi:hypothetical protein TNCV_2171431 [Trichonephila clavipes]|nr:hypothetical protein TNCV_2171431 [Trichonephila clavipes]
MITCTFHRPTLPQRLSPKSMISLVRFSLPHGNASKPYDPQEPTICAGELKQLFRERNRAREIMAIYQIPLHKTELNRIQNKIKERSVSTDSSFGRNTLLPWMPKTAPSEELLEHSGKRGHSISALNGPNGVALSDTNKTDLIAKSLEPISIKQHPKSTKDHIISNIVKHTLLIILTILTLSRLLFLRK